MLSNEKKIGTNESHRDQGSGKPYLPFVHLSSTQRITHNEVLPHLKDNWKSFKFYYNNIADIKMVNIYRTAMCYEEGGGSIM